MNRFYPILVCLLLPCFLFAAGGIKGYVKDNNGNAIEFATIYINEVGSGTVTNIDGYYEFRMLPGDYTVVFQHLGFESHTERISIGQDKIELNVNLKPQTFELASVEVVDGDEDPAYTVMRKAIAKADYHRQQLDYYKAQVYIKGSGRLLGTPWLARKLLEKEGIKADSNMAYTSESVSIIEYERPNTFKEKVISVYTQGEDNGSSPMGFINGSFYHSEIAESISPLSPKAFAYYRFEMAGFFTDRGQYINKIKVTPRSRGDNVFEGYIYIIEDLWAIHSLDLASYFLGIRFDINQVYAPIQEQVWLPVSHKIDVTGKFYGFKFDYKYLATLSDYDVKLNPDLDVDFAVIDEKIDKEIAKAAEERLADNPKNAAIEEKLELGEELTRKDLKRLMREYEKEERKEQEDETIIENHSYEVDSLASKRDSSYWATVRPIPLTKAEVRGYFVEDSTAVAEKQAAEDAENGVVKRKNKKNSSFSASDILFGTSFQLAKKKHIHYDGINNAGFNPVEGFWLASRLRYQQRDENNNRFRLHFTPRYGFSWDRLEWKLDADYRFGANPEKRSILYAQGGRYVSQYNEPHPVNEVFNTLYALLNERNFVRLYEKEFVKVGWRKKWEQTANIHLNAEWANRRSLNNTTTQTWINSDSRTYAPNIPDILEAPFFTPTQEKAATIDLSVGLRPWQKYKIRNGKKSSVAESSPLFTLNYKAGLPDINESVTDYHRIGLSYRQTIRPGVRGKIDIKLDAGLFLTDDYVGLADYQHFKGNRMFLTGLDPVGAFRLLPYYTFSTKDKWLSAHAHYQFRKFLFTQIWEVQMTGAKENVFVNYLNTPESKHYTEVGYGLDNVFRFFRIEGIVSFRDGKYYDWGIRIGIASNIFGGAGNVEIGED